MSSKDLELARAVFDAEIEGVETLKNSLGSSFEALADKCSETVRNGGKLVLCGVGKSGHIGKKIAATLASIGSPAIFLHPVEARHGDLGMIQKHDLLIAISYSGETDELLVVLNPAKRLGVPLAAITGYAESSLGKISDLVLEMRIPREACPFNLAPTTSTTALLVLGDALAMVLLDRCGFTKTDYGRLHPGGAIGRMVTMRATDLMRPLDRMAVVKTSSTVRETISAINQVRCGSALVVDDAGKLLGIFTDGDFRRWAEKCEQVLDLTMGETMTVNPVTVQDTMLASQVLKVLEDRRVDDLAVIDSDGVVQGCIDTQDLPGLKIM